MNSFVYLQKKFPDIYATSLIRDVNDVKELVRVANDLALSHMGTCDTCFQGKGTFDEDFILGKKSYIDTNAPGTTRYAAQISGKWREDIPGGSHPGAKKPDFVQDQTFPKVDFLIGELKKGEDVELAMGIHFVTLVGLTESGGVGGFRFIDPTGGRDLVGKLSVQKDGPIFFETETGLRGFIHGALVK